MTPKESVMDRLQRLPDDVTYEQIRDDIDALIGIEEGLEDFRQGRIYTHEQVVEMSESWITKAVGQPVP